MIVAVAGCVAQAEGAEIMRARAVRRYRVRPAGLSPAARDAGAARAVRRRRRARHQLSRRAQIRLFCPRPAERARQRDGLSDDPGRLRQVLHVLRRALHARRRVFAAGRAGHRRGAAPGRDGAREITLLGQNVNAYHGAGVPMGGEWRPRRAAPRASPKCRASCGSATRPRIRATSTTSWSRAHRDVPQLMPFLHLPVQSGSDRVLAAMNRRHTADDYRRIVDRLRAARPDLALLVGFHRRLSRRERRGFPRPPSTWSTRSASLRPFRSNTRRVPARRPLRCRTRCPTRSRPSGSPSCRRC